jgi:hypothetical protein
MVGRNTGEFILIEGPDNTLASIAEKIRDPEIFFYDPDKRTANSTTSLVIEGRLRLGDPDDPTVQEILELDTQVCGDLQLDVREGGELAVYNSSISTRSRIITTGACTRGYMLKVAGKLTMDHGTLQYPSGSLPSAGILETGQVVLRDANFTECDGTALRFNNADGGNISIDRCTFASSGEWGLHASGRSEEPIVVRDCVLDAKYGVVNMYGDVAIRMVDCQFDKAKIKFTRPTGRVQVTWTLDVKVDPGPNAGSVAGLRVVASSAEGVGIAETVEAVTDQAGHARLVLTEWVATPESAGASEGENDSTPHTFKVYAPSVSEPVAVLATPVRVYGKGQQVTITLPQTRADAGNRRRGGRTPAPRLRPRASPS